MNRDFLRQVAIQTIGTVFGGLVLYALAAFAGVVTVHPQQALTVGLAAFTGLCGVLIGYLGTPKDKNLRMRTRAAGFFRLTWRELAIGAVLAGTLGIAAVNVNHRTDTHHSACVRTTCHR